MLYDKDFDLVNSLNNGMGFLKPPSQGVWGRHDTAAFSTTREREFRTTM